MRPLEMFKKIIDNLENSDLPIYYFIFTFIFSVSLRIFLEIIVYKAGINLGLIVYYYAYFVFVGLSVILLIYIFTKEKIVKIFKAISVGFITLAILPIADFIINQKIGIPTPTYYGGDLVRGFLTLGGVGEGITAGMKIEGILFLFMIFAYFYVKKLSLVKNLVGVFSFYCLVYFHGTLPAIMQYSLGFLDMNFVRSDFSLINTLLFGIILLSTILAFLINKKIFLSIVKNIEFSRLFYYWLMFFFGILLVWKTTGGFRLNSENIFYLFFILISILFAGIFTAITNNIVDLEIDTISNKNRPLVKAEIDIDVYKKIGWFALAISLICALAVNFKVFFLTLFCIGNYFFYSMPPLRIKRVFFFSKLVILLNSVASVMLGFVAFSNLTIWDFIDVVGQFGSNINHFFAIAAVSAIIFLLASNFIDIKDYEGDKQAGIKTLPTVLGLRTSQFLIGIAFLFLYAIVGFLLKNWPMFSGLIIIGCIEFWLIKRKKYQEKYVFAVYLASLLVILYMIFK